MENAIFSYQIEDILKEVNKRTSYFGKMRGSENIPNLIDRMSLTDGEGFLAKEFLEDAVEQTYDWLKAFGRGVNNSHTCITQYTDHEEYKDYGISNVSFDGNSVSPTGIYKKELIPLESKDSYDYQYAIKLPRMYASSINPDGTRIKVTETIDFILREMPSNYFSTGNPITIEKLVDVKTTSTSLNDNEEIFNKSRIIELPNGTSASNFDIMYATYIIQTEFVGPSVVNRYEIGDIVEYHHNLNDINDCELYLVKNQCSSANWKQNSHLLDVDVRDRVVFKLRMPKFFDDNAISSVNRNIKEALVNYIIYRWFEYVKQDEAKAFYDKFEAYANNAKVGMNSNVSPLKRRSIILN